jgi:hypothetical protein
MIRILFTILSLFFLGCSSSKKAERLFNKAYSKSPEAVAKKVQSLFPVTERLAIDTITRIEVQRIKDSIIIHNTKLISDINNTISDTNISNQELKDMLKIYSRHIANINYKIANIPKLVDTIYTKNNSEYLILTNKLNGLQEAYNKSNKSYIWSLKINALLLILIIVLIVLNYRK